MFTLDSKDGVETFTSEAAVLAELKRTAAQEYTDKVVAWMASGKYKLEINNGPNEVETWTRS